MRPTGALRSRATASAWLTWANQTTSEGYTGTHTYDAIGNLTRRDEGGQVITYGYPAPGAPGPHRVTSESVGQGGSVYSYDANGNMGGRLGTYTWDVDNRLSQVVSSTQTTQFGYDADGRRVKQMLPDGTQIVYVGGIEVAITGTQRITKTYYSAGATLRLGSGQALIAMRVMTGVVAA